MELLDYKGSKFTVDFYGINGYAVTDIESWSEEVWIPEVYNDFPIFKLGLKLAEVLYHGVRILHIPKTLAYINFGRAVFPDLEEVMIDPDNKRFITDGKMIVEIGNREGLTLVRCLVCKGNRVEIPNSVKIISSKAFYGTHCTEIVFPKSNLFIDEDAFENSAWERVQPRTIVINELLFKTDCKDGTLVVPKGVKKFHPQLFHNNIPVKVICNFIPPRKDMKALWGSGSVCGTLEVTSPNAEINLNSLKEFASLDEFILPENHKRYQTIDGVLYSRDGKTLVFYPRGKVGSSFAIPDGVEKIAMEAFACNPYLASVIMPDSVKFLGVSAFYQCKRLSFIHFSSNLEEIPDSTVYTKGGVFEGCASLKYIKLPEKLKYLGSFVFYDSGLCSVDFNDQLEQLGEYTLAVDALVHVSLPASVKRLGRGSLRSVTEMEVYEGTAKGLISAINTTIPEEKDSIVNLCWHGCRVVVLHKDSEDSGLFLIPESLSRSKAYLLDAAWNQDVIDYATYEECLFEIKEYEERMKAISYRIPFHSEDEEDSFFFKSIEGCSFKLAMFLLQKKKEDVFLILLKRGILSQSSLQKLLEFSNEQGLTMCSAYIAEQQRKQKKSKRSFYL